MAKKISVFIDSLIQLSYLALAIITPLLFTTFNSELFEVPKMHFVYLISVILLFGTIAKSLIQGPALLKAEMTRPVLVAFVALTIFLIFQVVSTLTSIDKFTSVFGYPSRLNGGLLSQFSYFIIFATSLVNLKPSGAKKLLVGLVIGATGVSVWGIPSHFGLDPTCYVFVQKLTSSCWQKEFDPTLRIFATLGQPNWLASYLTLILPVSIAFFLSAVKRNHRILFFASSLLIFTAIVMTNSRAGILGAFIGISILTALNIKNILKNKFLWILIYVCFAAVILLFGKFLFERFFEAKNTIQIQNNERAELPQTSLPPAPAGTESSEIRIIVWQGALKAFRAKPVLGWGPETFAYSYYKFRPFTHNATTEWNFFYNKAHNEFLNYLANIGTVGTLSYLTFLGLSIYYILIEKDRTDSTLRSSAVSALAGYHTTIFFGFSTVATQTAMFLTIACALLIGAKAGPKKIKLNLNLSGLIPLLLIVFLLFIFSVSFIIRSFFADLFYARKTTRGFANAIETFPIKNPFYLSDYAYNLASAAQDGDEKEEFSSRSLANIHESQRISPANLIIEKRLANAYILLLKTGKADQKEAISAAQKLKNLSPTDPQSYITSAKIYLTIGDLNEAKKEIEKALDLKPGLIEALELLDQINTKILEEESPK